MSERQKIPRLTEKTAQKIYEAAQDAEQAVKAGSSADAALAQAAKKHGLSKEQTKLLVQGWNIEKSLSSFSKAAGFFERVNSSPPIAHYDSVITLMGDIPESESKQASIPIWEGYYSPPKVDIFDTAPAKIASQSKVGDAQVTIDGLGQRIRDKLAREHLYRKEVLKKAKAEIEVLKAKLREKREEVKWAFRAVRAGFEDVAANLKVAKPEAYRFLLSMKEEIPQDFEKEAFHVRYNPRKYPYSTILEAAEIDAKLKKLAGEVAKLEVIDKKLGELKLGSREEVKDPTYAGPGGYYYSNPGFNRNSEPLLKAEDLEELEKEAQLGTLISTVSSAPRHLAAGASEYINAIREHKSRLNEQIQELEEKVVKSLREPFTSRLISQLGTSTNLALIVSQDPELSNYPMEEVAETYAYLSQLAPEVMKNPLVARTVLKQALSQGGLGTFDIEFLTKIEEQYSKSRYAKGQKPDLLGLLGK